MNEEKYYAIASSKRDGLSYKNSVDDVKLEYSGNIFLEGTYPKGYSDAMGDSYIYARFKNLDTALSFDKKIREKNRN